MYLIWSRPKRSNLKANKACDEYLFPFIYMYNVRVRYLQHARNNAQ